MYRRSDLA
jgi:hypothetical protein